MPDMKPEDLETEPEKLMACFKCGKHVSEDFFCHGCGEYICAGCDSNWSLGFGAHTVEEHFEEPED